MRLDTADDYAVGDRVRVRSIPEAGKDFHGLVGIVTKVADDYYYVHFDLPPAYATVPHGGGWSDSTLELALDPVTDEEEAAAIRSILNV